MKPATRDISAELAAIDAIREEDIDLSDAPEITDWSGAVRGKFYRPEKHAVSIRLDADVLDWFRATQPKYQTAINQVLREHMQARLDANPDAA